MPSRRPSSSTVPSRSVRAVVLAARKISPLPWCAVEPVRARPSPTRRASRSQPSGSTGASVTTTPMQEPAGLGGSSCSGSSRPTGTPSTVSRSRWPKLVISSTATVWPPGVTRDDVPMPPLKPRHDIPVPPPTDPSSGGAADPRDASAASWAARTSSGATHMVRMSLRKESSHSATTGTKMSSTSSGCRPSSSMNAAS